MSDIAAISMWQPWASLWLSRCKLHETRHWTAAHRGPLLVHATKHIETKLDYELAEIVEEEFGPHWAIELPRGALIGMVNLMAIVPTEALGGGDVRADDRICGNFAPGRFAWRRGVYRKFPTPIPYRGRQSMFRVPHSVVAGQIAAAMEMAA